MGGGGGQVSCLSRLEETQHSREITRKMAGRKRENVRTFYDFRGFIPEGNVRKHDRSPSIGLKLRVYVRNLESGQLVTYVSSSTADERRMT